MLTKIDGQWIDLGEVAQIFSTDDSCCIHLKGDPDSIDIHMPADEIAALVNAAQVKANVRLLDRKVEDEYACSACGGSGLVADEAERDHNLDEAYFDHFESGQSAGRQDGFRLGLCYALLQRDSLVKHGGYLTLLDAHLSAFKEIETRAGATSESIAESIQEAIHWRMKRVAQDLAAGLGTERLRAPEGPEPSQTTPTATKSLTEAASASNGFLWAVAFILYKIALMEARFPDDMPKWLIQQLESLRTNRVALEAALITGKIVCDQRERDGDERD